MMSLKHQCPLRPVVTGPQGESVRDRLPTLIGRGVVLESLHPCQPEMLAANGVTAGDSRRLSLSERGWPA